MEFIKKLREVLISVMPIVLIALVLGAVYGAFVQVSLLGFLHDHFEQVLELGNLTIDGKSYLLLQVSLEILAQ